MVTRRWLGQCRIGVLMGGTSAEREISLKTGQAVYHSLKRQGFKVFPIDASRALPDQLKKNKIDFAYIALHGPGGEDGVVQGLLEWLRIPFTGPGVLASALAMDKIASKRLFRSAGLTTAPWLEVPLPPRWGKGGMGVAAVRNPPPQSSPTKGEEVYRSIARLGFPLVIKPARQGSAIGVSIVKSAGEIPSALGKALRYGSPALAEKFLQGPEITVGVLGQQVLPIIEIVPTDRAFYDFHAKYAPGGSRHILPARISAQAASQAEALSLAACRILGIGSVARVDLIVDKRLGPCLLEVNTSPGMTETSLLPDAARAAGISFDALVLRIMESSVGPA